jgi:hypothetical protein
MVIMLLLVKKSCGIFSAKKPNMAMSAIMEAHFVRNPVTAPLAAEFFVVRAIYFLPPVA